MAPVAILAAASEGRPGGLKLIQPHERVYALTNAQGRFALEVEPAVKGDYYLMLCHNDYADEQLTDVAPDQHDLQVRLQRGGTVAGRAFFLADGKKIPLADTEVSVQVQIVWLPGICGTAGPSRRPMRRAGSRSGVCPSVRDRSVPPSEPDRYVPVPWQVRCGAAMLVLATVTFENNGDRRVGTRCQT